jgi:hypothetical protein
MSCVLLIIFLGRLSTGIYVFTTVHLYCIESTLLHDINNDAWFFNSIPRGLQHTQLNLK